MALLAALTTARVAYGAQFQAVGAVGPAMVADLGLAYASLGTLVGAYSALGVALALPAGWLVARLGERRIVLGGLALMIVGGAVLALAPGFGAALAGRLVSGAGAMLLIVALPMIIAHRFTGAALPAAMGTLLAGYPFGIGLGFVALPLVGSWRAAMAVPAAIAVAALAAAAITLRRNATGAAAAQASQRSLHRPDGRETAAVVAAGLVWGCPNAGLAAVLGFAPVFFVGRGMSAEAAGALVSSVAFACVPAGPIGGWLLGRMRRPTLGIAGGLALAALSVALLAGGVAPAAALVATGVALGTVAGSIVALPVAVLPPERRALGMGLFWLVFFASMTLLPPLAGLARDLSGDPSAPLGAAVVFMGLGLVALLAHVALRPPTVSAAAAAAPGVAARSGR